MRTPGSQVLVQRLVDDYLRSAFPLCLSPLGVGDGRGRRLHRRPSARPSPAWVSSATGLRRPWLFRILRDLVPPQSGIQQAGPTVALEGVGDLPDACRTLPEVDTAQLQQALNELPGGLPDADNLDYAEDITYRDIADQMELPIGTVIRGWPGRSHTCGAGCSRPPS